jgi:hypothetical protein
MDAASLTRNSLPRSFPIGTNTACGATNAVDARTPIRVMNLADYSVEKLPWENINDGVPMWIGRLRDDR